MDKPILPADSYIVVNKSIITNVDKKILNMLYLPIVGSIAIMLYNILTDDLDNQELISEELTHSHLLSNLHISTKELENARNVLEGIGLIKTYIKEENVTKYIYELYSPVSAHEFFTHPIFNIVLYNNLGKKEYEKLVNYFKMPKINKEGYNEITHSFSTVFESIPHTKLDIYNDNIKKYNKQKLNINSPFDINLLINSLPKEINKKILNKDIQELIISLAYLYDIDAEKMQNILKTCITEKGTINKEEIRKTCRNHYQFDHSGVLPTIIERTQPDYLRKPIGDNSKLAKMIYTFETISPYDFLKSKQNGGEPVKRDITLIEDLIIDYKLQPGVVNVLIDYVLKTNDNKLTRNLVETIAGQWSRKKIETVEDAMEIAKKSHKSIEKNKNSKQTNIEKKLPVWFNNQDITIETATIDEQNEIDDLLKEFR